MTFVVDHEMILVFLHQILIISGLSLLLGLEIIFSRWTWSLTREKCENYYSYSGGNYSSLIMNHTFFIKCLCDFFKSDSVNQVHVQHNEKLHHVSNLTHSILSWLIFNCGGFCTTKIGDMSPMGKNLHEIHENSVRRHFAAEM